MSEAEPLISVRDLVQKIGLQEILRGFSLDIFRGETLVLLGKSGGGKSVFLRHLIGLMKPISGQIIFEGQDIAILDERQLAPVRRKIGMLFQDGALFDSLNVYDNVAFPLREHGEKDEKLVRHKVHEALALVNMTATTRKCR
jgi:phospholipid/cholesterol/gamma-HCH transport system ATP-binding protein